MTFILKDIADHLNGSTDILDAFDRQIHPETLPQGANPEQYILINDISSDPSMSLDGEAGNHTTIVQIDVWTNGVGGRTRCNELAELVRNRLNGYRGQFGEGEYGTAMMIRNDSLAQPPGEGSDLWRRRQSMDFQVNHTASVPDFT